MPSRNRVDDLEDEVDELKATVQGLTEELVEAHERIRQIERALAGDSQAARDAAREAAHEVATDIESSIADADPQEVAEAAARAEAEAETEPTDPETTEGDKNQATEGGDEADGDADDIIVA
jgi:predicted  nucleic acid-binding Zn-ribbon protein